MTLNAYALIGIAVAVTNVIVGVVVFLFAKDRTSRRIFGILAALIFNWGFSSFWIATAKTPASGLFWWQIGYISVIWMPVVFFHFVCLFLKIKRRVVLWLSYSYASICTLAVFYKKSKYFIGGVKYVFNQFYWNIDPQPLHIGFFFLIFFGLVMYCVVLMIGGMKRVDYARRKQIQYYLLGSGIAWVGGELHFLLTFQIAEIYPYFNFLLVLYPIIMGYAIVRHNLMDIVIIIKKTLVFAGLFAVSYGVFAGFAYLGTMLFENVVENRWIALAPSMVVIVLILRPLENFLVNVTDRFLFQKKYDYRELLKTFTGEVLTVLQLKELFALTVNKLVEIVKLNGATFFVYDEEEDRFECGATTLEDVLLQNTMIPGSNGAQQYISGTDHYVFSGDDNKALEKVPPQIREVVERTKAVMMLPLVHNDKVLGFLLLSAKKSDEDFTADDVAILAPLASATSIAITNAQLFNSLSVSQAQAAQREKMAVIGTLSAGINHEICNPLGIIRGQSEMFLMNMEDGVYGKKEPKEIIDKAVVIFEKVVKETDRATEITRRLSSFSKPSKDDIEHDVVLKDELEEVAALLEPAFKEHRVKLETDVPEDLPLITANRKQLQEVLFNIMRNGAQAIEKDGGIAVSVLNKNDKVEIRIKDTGCGIPKSKLSHIFDPFYTTKDPGKGTGLGLFIVRQVVERNGGTIEVESEEGVGTEFILTFKTAKVEAVS